MDLSGFYLSGDWADDDDDTLELSGTLFPRRAAKGTHAQPLLANQSQGPPPPAASNRPWKQDSPAANNLATFVSPSTASSPLLGLHEQPRFAQAPPPLPSLPPPPPISASPPASTSVTSSDCVDRSASSASSSRTVKHPLHREPKSSVRSRPGTQTDTHASVPWHGDGTLCSPHGLLMQSSALPTTTTTQPGAEIAPGLGQAGAERSPDLNHCLQLTSPKLPPPLQTPITPPNDRYADYWDPDMVSDSDLDSDWGSDIDSPPGVSAQPAASNGFYPLKPSSSASVDEVAALKSRAVTPSGAWRFDFASQQDGLRMHRSAYSPIKESNEFETVAPTGGPYGNLVEPKKHLTTIHEDPIFPDTSYPANTKPLPPPPPPSPSHMRIYVGTICLAQAIAGVILAQGLVPARTISESLHGRETREPGEIIWLTSACTLGAAAFSLPASRIANVIGYKKVFVGSLMWLMCWTEVIVFGRHVQDAGDSGAAFVCSCRALQGVGLGFLVPVSFDMIHQAYPSTLYITLAAVSGIVGFVIGGLVNCLFATPGTWKWSFVSLTMIILALAVLGMLVVPSSRRRREEATSREPWRTRLDALGMGIGIFGSLLFLIGLNLLSITSPQMAHPYLILGIGIALLAWFFFNQRTALRPIVPFTAFTGKTYVVLACIASYWASFAVWLWYLIQTLEHLREWKPMLTSAAMIPLAVISVAAMSTQHLIDRVAGPELLLVISALLGCVGSILMSTADTGENFWLSTFFSILLMSPGIVVLTIPAMRLVDDSVVQRYAVSSTALVFGVAMFAGSTALGVAGAIEKSLEQDQDQDSKSSSLAGYRGPQHLGVGISGLGVVLSVGLLATIYIRRS